MKNSLIKDQTNKALFIIDVQEKIFNPIKYKEKILHNLKKLLKAYEILEKNIYITEQNPSKLGSTINELIPQSNYILFDKMSFSIGKEKNIYRELKSKSIRSIIVCGLETHICVQQTVIDFLRNGFDIFIVADAMGSRDTFDHDIALQRMIQMGAILTTTESIIFELCKTANRKEFKEIRDIIMS